MNLTAQVTERIEGLVANIQRVSNIFDYRRLTIRYERKTHFLALRTLAITCYKKLAT
ncbi:hypothetical protein K1T34_40705 [Amycolatopsis sp. DSM 110486]|nr:hypothetical protein [Amycolatopsis sp. DSM 110486]QYN18951.1 hypothetical protein K1T34_40705 [Amycolatopsis sp. DSM 110486]